MARKEGGMEESLSRVTHNSVEKDAFDGELSFLGGQYHA